MRAWVGHDVPAFWQAGGRVREWIRFERARVCAVPGRGSAAVNHGADLLTRATGRRLNELASYRTDSSGSVAVGSLAGRWCSTAPRASSAVRWAGVIPFRPVMARRS